MRTLLLLLFSFLNFYSFAQDSLSTATRHRSLRCYPIYENTKIGLTYSAIHMVPGIELDHYLVYRRLFLQSNIECRLPAKNAYLSAEFIKHHVFNWGAGELIAYGSFKQVANNDYVAMMQYCLGVGASRWASNFIVAYARKPQTLSEGEIETNNGIMLRLYKELCDTQITASGIYWFNQIQFSVKAQQNIQPLRLNVGLGFEQISNWREVTISACYSL